MKKFGKGMFKDTARVDQPEGTMRDALNANLNDKKGSISNEWGTYNYVNNINYRVFGRAVLDDDRIVLFGQQVDMVMGPDNYEIPTYTDQIRVLNTRNQDVIILYQSPGLNFQQTHPIVTTHRKNQAGEYLVYFTDGYEREEEIYDGFDYVTEYNPPRVINVSKQIQWRFGGGAVNTLYNPTNTHHKLQLIPRVGVHTTFLSANIIEGGKLGCAAYYLAIAYADQDGLETNYFVVSNPVYIAPGPENTLPTNSFIGAEGGTPTSKAIRWVTFTPQGIDYQMLQPAVLKLQKNALTAVKIPAVAINSGGNTEITYTGTEDLQEISTDDIVIDDVNYITADTISQLDNRLYLGNVASNKDIGFQPFAHNIQINTVLDDVADFNPRLYDTFILNQGYTKLLQVFHEEVGQQFERLYLYDPDDNYLAQSSYIDSYQDLLRTYATEQFDNTTTRKGYRNPAYSFFRKSYRRGEVYAFYISFVLNDGSETYAYHIPGRLPECVDWETVNNGDTLYEQTSGFVRFTFGYDFGPGPGPTLDKKITFYQVPQSYTLTDGTTLNAGLYFVGTNWNSSTGTSDDIPNASNWSSGNCPNFETVSLTSSNFVTSSITSGGPWPSGSPTSPENNVLWQWMYNNFPSEINVNLTGTYQEEFLACPVNILTTAYTEGGGSLSGTMCENDPMALTPYDGTRAAFGFRPEELLEQNNDLDVYQVLDTSRQTNNSTGYWENSNEFYPNTQDFLLGQVFNDGSSGFDLGPGGTMAGDNVRHHKMPSNLTDSSFISRETTNERSYSEQARKPYTGGFLSTVGQLDNNGSLVTTEDISILGIQLSNLRIPREILQQVQGYKIYYAKRDQKDKTILGQSLAVPGHPRYAASPKQSLEEAVTGPFVKAFYMYGGLDHTDGSSIATLGKWKGAENELTGPDNNLRLRQFYWSNPVFKFHDFAMLRNRVDLSSVTHVQAQYGVMFRLFQGGPGVFVKPCEYSKIWDAPSYFDTDVFDGGNGWAADLAVSNQEDSNLKIFESHATSFPSMGWVGPEMTNTVDFYWFDPRYNLADDDEGVPASVRKALQNQSHVLDISDGTEGELTTIYKDNNDGDVQDETASLGTGNGEGTQGAKRARQFKRGEDITQPANDSTLSKPDRTLAIKAKEARVRAFITSTMIATVYVSPSTVMSNTYIIKAGDFKIPYRQPTGISLQRWYQEGNFDDNQLTLAVEPGGKILLHGRENHSSKDAAAFKGADILFNRSGETAHVFSLVSGLPGLKGHAPFYPYNPDNPNQTTIWTTGARPGLIRWGETRNYLYPDAAVEGVPYIWMIAGDGNNGTYQDNNGGQLYDPSIYRGLNYTLTSGNNFNGLPMAWLVNVCATRTDVFNPFDKQNLVWTGYYHKIYEPNFETGEAGDFQGNISNYYEGGTSNPIFGGDTYISKYSFRTTSQSYGHSYFRANRQQGDPVAKAIAYSPFGEDEGLADYLNNGGITTSPLRFQGDLPANMNPYTATNNPPNNINDLWPSLDRFGLTSTQPIWNFAHLRALDQGDYEADSALEVASKTLDVIQDSRNWVKGNVNPVSTVFTFMCETDDLVEFRHVDDEERGESTLFFDYNTAHKTIFTPPYEDLTDPDKLLYGDHYSALQNLKVTSPLPVYSDLAKVQTFPNRVVRSDVDSGSLADGYRKFKALEFKDIPTHRGDIKNLFDLQGNLYIHTEKALFVTKGKEELQLSAVTAFIGSGNIFVQDPDEVMQSDTGYGGTTSRHAHVTTPYGHFFVNQRDRKIFNLSPKGFQDITNGLESWLRENMPFVVERFGINLDSPNAIANGYYVDASTQVNVPLGFTVGYDPLFKRVLFTKHEPVPTQNFFDLFYSGAIVVYNDIPYRVDTADVNCIEPGSTVDPTGDIEDPRGRNQTDDAKLAGEVYCGPIWFGNPYYFTQRSWTISYYPEMQVWGSRHSYGPNLYTNTSEYMVSFAWGSSQDSLGADIEFYGSWEHSNDLNPGRFYGELYNFEVEFIDNTGAAESKLFSNMFYWAESFLVNQTSVSEQFRVSNPVFDEFYAYNSTQITGLPKAINYLNNARLVDRMWYINDIRDMSVQQQLDEGELITGTENVAGNITTSVTVHPQGEAMFTEEGVVNNNYVNINKEWYNQRKMIDHYLGVRLIKDNTNRNLVHLYAAGTKFRKSFR